MTRLRGASLDNPDIAQPGGGGERPQYSRSKIPPNAPEVVVQNTIELSDSSRVLPWYRDERRRRFNVLVRRYKNQLLHGCDDPGCRTPTCASRRRRVSEGPYRRYTELSARTLACYLASQEDAESGLCCNNPRYSSELTIHDYHRISLQRSRAFQVQAAAATAAEKGNVSQPQHAQTDGPDFHTGASAVQTGELAAPGDAGRPAAQDVHPSTYNFQDLNYTAEQPLKDPKSFTQNLFDTLSLRMVEWLPLRRTTEPLPSRKQPETHPESIEATNPGKRQDIEKDKTKLNGSQSTPSHAQNPPPRTPSSRTSGTQASAVELKFQNQHVKRLSITEVDHWRQSPRSSLEEKKCPEYKNRKLSINSHLAPNEFASMPSPPALKHRAQKHRGRSGDIDSTRPKERSKNQRRVSWDSEKLLGQAAISASPGNPQLPPPQPDIDVDTPTNRKPKSSSMRRTADVTPLAQSVTHFTPDIINGLSQIMIASEEDAENWREELDRIQSMGSFDNPDWRFATPRQRQVFPFVAQSVYFVFSSTRQILRSFGKDTLELGTATNNINKRLDIPKLRESLQRLFTICPWDIALHSLWSALDKLFVPPDEFTASSRPSRRSSRNSTIASVAPVVRRLSESPSEDPLSDADAAYIATITFFVLISSVPDLDVGTWRGILRMRAAGTVASSADMEKLSPEYAQQAVEATDRLEHELGLRLINRLVRALTARLAYHEISKARQVYSLDLPKQRRLNVLDRIVDHLSEHQPLKDSEIDSTSTYSTGPIPLIVEWLRTLFLREWDGNPEMARSSAAGGAIQILALMYKERNRLGLFPEDFQTPILAERLDPLEMPVSWVGNVSNNRTIHLLSYSFLFPPSFLVIYFRALNYSAMSKYYEAAMTTTRHVTQTAFGSISVLDDAALLARMKISMSTFLVLVVRRDSVLTDALNQLWRRERRELMRPLKVQMGMDEGEEGLDHGGVQQEFFRVLMAEALDPSYGMFTMDSRHRISWFRPCSWEPLYKFELLGLLMSIAVYNGLTLPINFPVAFYRKLLGLKVKHLDHIRDGWPELTQGLDSLLTWKDGDVSDIFMRTYEFSFESVGSVETVDMQKVGRDEAWPTTRAPSGCPLEAVAAWPDGSHYRDLATVSPPSPMAGEAADPLSPSASGEAAKFMQSLPLQSPTPPADEAPLVTNQNRTQFVKDYIFWLTDKSIRLQFEAFLRGFHTCLDRSALSVFTPEALKTVVEGLQEIDVKELENHARYEGGFGPDHRLIRDFWGVVQQYPSEKKAQLLEFVTASDRIPVNGIPSIMFVIQKNGVGDLRLPTSLTCFGRLLLPEYSSKDALAEKLDKALENARGFGVA
ncbi:uncharacterized protein N7482_004437 [Penicillium canariense]|uniref:HECT-type E3 ubiquitin transferase n=1 Tax=Penicillium canariense TaxID=189055 RepID=A0A9W9I8Q6_9EURO|nr:uncharacterized protein N7482_004437 [Penicillium canariense]KAJ5168843.1 hypothetical protein N7482_004437 [Penicillium canariense]